LISEKLDDVLSLFVQELMVAYAIRQKEREKEKRDKAAEDVLSTIMGGGKGTMRTRRRDQLASLKPDPNKEEAKEKSGLAAPRGDGMYTRSCHDFVCVFFSFLELAVHFMRILITLCIFYFYFTFFLQFFSILFSDLVYSQAWCHREGDRETRSYWGWHRAD
jgi:hypothetical protein